MKNNALARFVVICFISLSYSQDKNDCINNDANVDVFHETSKCFSFFC